MTKKQLKAEIDGLTKNCEWLDRKLERIRCEQADGDRGTIVNLILDHLKLEVKNSTTIPSGIVILLLLN